MQLQHTITYNISGSCGMFIYYSAKDNIFTYIHTYIHGAHSGSPQLLVNIFMHPYFFDTRKLVMVAIAYIVRVSGRE